MSPNDYINKLETIEVKDEEGNSQRFKFPHRTYQFYKARKPDEYIKFIRVYRFDNDLFTVEQIVCTHKLETVNYSNNKFKEFTFVDVSSIKSVMNSQQIFDYITENDAFELSYNEYTTGVKYAYNHYFVEIKDLFKALKLDNHELNYTV